SPYTLAKEEMLGNWIKESLKEVNIDINVYKLHSTRSTPVTITLEKGVNVKLIIKSAVWATFKRHYFKPKETIPSLVVKALLSGQDK
ncbi:6799_t:CDS:1, partial [Gigaspora rosea]